MPAEPDHHNPSAQSELDSALSDNGDDLELALLTARVADDKKATDVVVLDVGDVLGVASYFVVAGAPNRRLVRTVAEEIERAVNEQLDRNPVRSEGVREQQWVLIDYGDVVVHVFLEEIRAFYEIERLYRDAPNVPWRPASADASLSDPAADD